MAIAFCAPAGALAGNASVKRAGTTIEIRPAGGSGISMAVSQAEGQARFFGIAGTLLKAGASCKNFPTSESSIAVPVATAFVRCTGSVSRIRAVLSNGADTFKNSTSIADAIFGRAGNGRHRREEDRVR